MLRGGGTVGIETRLPARSPADIFQFNCQLFDSLKTIVGILCQTTTHYSLQLGRRIRIQLSDRLRGLTNYFVERVNCIAPCEGFASGYRFKQNAAKRENVGTLVDLAGLALRLLG